MKEYILINGDKKKLKFRAKDLKEAITKAENYSDHSLSIEIIEVTQHSKTSQK